MKKYCYTVLFFLSTIFTYCFADDSNTIDTLNLDNPVYLIYSSDDHKTGYLIKNIQDTLFNTIPCVSGYEIREDKWMFGKKVFIPITKIASIILFYSYTDYCTSLKKYDKSVTEKRRKKN